MSLSTYHKKRNFKETSEPKGGKPVKNAFRFVVQRHAASHLHYDFRLELGGVLKSWAVPKGPPVKTGERRLAVMTEDHPVDYIHFEGVIPKGNYGAGVVKVWDKGVFEVMGKNDKPLKEASVLAQLKKGELSFTLKGKKLKGNYAIVQMGDEKNWLLIRKKDEGLSSGAPGKKATAVKKKAVTATAARKKKAITPMLASSVKNPFDDPGWVFEIKWDGYRAIAETGKQLAFYSRNGLDFREKFKSIADELSALKINAVLDGEVVALDEKGVSHFQLLQQAAENPEQILYYYVFDLLEYEGKNLMDQPLLERKKLLKKVLGKHKLIRYCDHIPAQGISFFEAAKQEGLEGIIAKQKDSTYAPGYRSNQWLKIKLSASTEVLIAGYTAPKGSRSAFGSLVLAGEENGELVYRGHVGTGFNEKTLAGLKKKMDALKTEHSPFKERVRLNDAVTWIKPKLVAEIAYGNMTEDGVFRHPVFMRLRDDKDKQSLNEEITEAMATKETKGLTNPQKVFWPKEGYTKADLFNYYEKMSSYVLPYLKGRPLSLNRFPNGIDKPGFYHKDAGENVPSFVDVFKVKSESNNKIIDYIVCNNKSTLLYLANLGCVDMNPWNSTTKKITNPTWMVIDIDPSSKNKFTQVVDTALATKEVLDRAGVDSYCKTSGATGLHVYVPLNNRYDYDQVKDFAHLVASMVNDIVPGFTTLERPLSKRKGRIYIDFLQNRRGQTLASPYSLRPVPGASVSTPLDWKEVNHNLDPADYNIKNILKRVEKKGDLFKPVLGKGASLEKAVRMLEK